MPCYHPLKAFKTATGVVFDERQRHGDYQGDLELPCGQCIGCRLRRASDWTLRICHEQQMHRESCAVTLTYAPGNLPAGATLQHRDFVLFMKRSVKNLKRPVRYYMCGEYGDEGARPHYHACLFGVDFYDRVQAGKSESGSLFYFSQQLTQLWKLGRASVQDLTPETASYCARYIQKKQLGKSAEAAYQRINPLTGEIYQVKPEYSAMSLKPGIGYNFYQKYKRDIYPHDFVIQNGSKRTPPKYYDRLHARAGAVELDEIEYARQQRAQLQYADNTDERRRVRETVHLARVANLKRGLK